MQDFRVILRPLHTRSSSSAWPGRSVPEKEHSKMETPWNLCAQECFHLKTGSGCRSYRFSSYSHYLFFSVSWRFTVTRNPELICSFHTYREGGRKQHNSNWKFPTSRIIYLLIPD